MKNPLSWITLAGKIDPSTCVGPGGGGESFDD